MSRRLAAWAGVALMTLGLGSAPAATAATVEDAAIRMVLTDYAPSVLVAQGQLLAAVDVTNTGFTPAPGLRIELRVTEDALTSRSALDAFLASPDRVPTVVATTRPVTTAGVAPGTGEAGTLPAGGTEPVTVAATPTMLGLDPGTSGVFGVVLAVVGPDGVVTSRALPLTWYDGAVPALPVAVIATASGAPERVAQVAAASNISGVALAADPTAFAEDAEGEALAASREIFALPSGGPDLASLAHAGDEDLIAFALTDAATNTAPALRDLPWLAILANPDAATVEYAANHGATAGLLDTSLGSAMRQETYAPVMEVSAGEANLPVLVPEQGLSSTIAEYDPFAADGPALVAAEAALLAWEIDGTSSVVVAPGARWQLAGLGASPLLKALIDAPWVIPVTVNSVLSGTQRTAVTAADEARTSEDMAPEDVATLSRQLERVDNLAQTAEDPNDIYVPSGRTLVAPLTMSLRGLTDARDAALAASVQTVDTTLAGLRVPDSSDVNLLAASGNLPVTVQNDLAVDATVRVVVRSSSPNLRVLESPTVTVPAGGTATARVPVEGVSSANIVVTVALENTRGDAVAPPQATRIRVRADWGNAVTVAFTVGLVFLLVAGVIRTVRRGRAGTRVPPLPEDAADAAARRGPDHG